jgi:membrane protease YdiL (CAAX protease family)
VRNDQGGDKTGTPREKSPARLVIVAYGGLTALALVIGAARGAPNLLRCAPIGGWPLSGLASDAASAALGLCMAAVVILATRALVRTRPWAAALHEDLRPMARALGEGSVIVVALASSIGEEALFRGALVPALDASLRSPAGAVLSSLLFGAMHQMRGRSRVAWWAFATVVGLAFAGLFRLTGSLVGPILAHAAINAANLRFLLSHDPTRAPRLGGLLGPQRR